MLLSGTAIKPRSATQTVLTFFKFIGNLFQIDKFLIETVDDIFCRFDQHEIMETHRNLDSLESVLFLNICLGDTSLEATKLDQAKCDALGHCRLNVVASINGVFFFSFFSTLIRLLSSHKGLSTVV